MVAGIMACALGLTLLITGCATPKPSLHTEELLQSSGFKIVVATTPAEKAQLQTLRPGKLTVVRRDGKTWYVYPNAARHQLYVGNPDQYQAYRQAYQDEQMVRGQVDSVLLREDTADWTTGALTSGSDLRRHSRAARKRPGQTQHCRRPVASCKNPPCRAGKSSHSLCAGPPRVRPSAPTRSSSSLSFATCSACRAPTPSRAPATPSSFPVLETFCAMGHARRGKTEGTFLP